MVTISGGLYAAVRYAPHFNKDRPFQVIATDGEGDGTYITQLSYEEGADLVKSLALLLLREANKDA